MGDEWYYVDAGNAQQGPKSVEGLGALFKATSISPETLVWKDGLDAWKALSQVPTLFSQVQKMAAPPPALPSIPTGPPAPPAKPMGGGGRGSVAGANLPGAMGVSPHPEHARQLSGKQLALLSKGANWVEKKTVDGVPYYWNASTETVTWEKPESLKTASELEQSSGAYCWVSDETLGWAPARVLKESGGKVEVELENGTKKSVKPSDKEPLWPLQQSSLKRAAAGDDLVMVDDINQGLMVHCLRERYKKDKIYTWVGAGHSVLVSINPFKQLPIYTASIIEEYSRPSAYRPPPPHTFAIANSAYVQMSLESTSQAILISGESGAGKTEATKQCFNFLADVSGSADNVEQRILYANPLLEAFGNAKTLRNNNSSRFGRWTEIHFDGSNKISSAKIENYLLEKQRVVSQAKGERNFHIFYQLCCSDVAATLGLDASATTTFRYLASSGCSQVVGVDDRKDFLEVEEAFDHLGFSFEEKCWAYQTCAAALHLGNLEFLAYNQGGSEGSRIHDRSAISLQSAANLLGVTVEEMSLAFTSRSIDIRGDVTMALNRPDQARDCADALAKAMYDHMFDWLIGRINLSVAGASAGGRHAAKFIGVLDIFGFEIFEKNHFEQLCINYTNEKLQQHFNKHTFKEEESVYQSEQVRYEHVSFIDNQAVVDLIEKKPYGLMPLLDEEVKVPKGNDQGWLSKCKQNNLNHPCLPPNPGGSSAMRFMVTHYAGDVGYDCGGFVDTNRDALIRDVYDLIAGGGSMNMGGSSSQITKMLFPPKDNQPRRTTTLGEKFRKALGDLMEVVDGCSPWYIRCIKPNDAKASNRFESKMCVEQLTYAGVFEAVKIRKTGYPFRLPHARFANRYRCLAFKESGWQQNIVSMAKQATRSGEFKSLCDALLRCVHQDFSKVQIGRTMVLYRAEEHRVLELLRNLCLERVMPVAQRMARRKLGRKFRRYMKEARRICAQALRDGAGGNAAALEAAIQRAEAQTAYVKACFAWEPYEMRLCRDMLFALSERILLMNMLGPLCQRVEGEVSRGAGGGGGIPSYGELRSAVARINKIKHIPGTPDQAALEERARGLLHQASAAKIDPIAHEALALLEVKMMKEIAAEADSVEYNSADISNIKAKLALPEEELVKLQLEVARQLNDPERVINREIKLKEMYLDANGAALFELPQLPALRGANEWAGEKPLKTMAFSSKKKDSLAASYLVHTTDPIHKALTSVCGVHGAAVKAFKNLLGYCGDRKYQYPDTAIREIVKSGLEDVEGGGLRGEVYVQVMKQLRSNPSQTSQDRCWEVMMLLLSCFPPPKDFENYVHHFVRTNSPENTRDKFKLAVHMSIYEGAKAQVPSDKEIPGILSAFFNREIKERYNIEEDIVAVRPATSAPQRPGWNIQAVGGSAGVPAVVAAVAPAAIVAQIPMAYGNGGNAAAAAAMPRGPPPPLPPKKPSLPLAKVLFDYSAEGQDGMLSVSEGMTLTIKDKSAADWWMAELPDGSAEGWVPANYVELL